MDNIIFTSISIDELSEIIANKILNKMSLRKNKVKPKKPEGPDQRFAYEEWQVLRNPTKVNLKEKTTVTTFDKLKLLRPHVLLTKDQAEILNHGRLVHVQNKVFDIYLLPGEDAPVLEKRFLE